MAFVQSLLEISLMTSVMISIVFAIRLAFSRKMNIRIPLFLWALVLIRLCLPVTFTSPVNITDLFPDIPAPTMQQPEQAAGPVGDVTLSTFPQTHNRSDLSAIVQAEPATDQITAQPEAVAAPEPSVWRQLKAALSGVHYGTVLLVLWASGASFILLFSLRQAFLFRRKLKVCPRIEKAVILDTVNQYKESTRIKRTVFLLECNFIRTPMVCGYRKPAILLPATFAKDMGMSRLSGILIHELCHIRRHDILKNYIWLLAKTVHWFNPLVWFAYKAYQDDVELRCDEMVAGKLAGDTVYDYTQSLIDASRMAQRSRTPALTSHLAESHLRDRILRLVVPQKRSRMAVTVSVMMTIVMMIACFTTACQPAANEPVSGSPLPSASPIAAFTAEPVASPTPNQTSDRVLESTDPSPTASKPPVFTAEELLPFQQIPLDFTYEATGTYYNDFQVDSAGNLYVTEPIVKNSTEKDPGKWDVNQMRIRKYDKDFNLLKEYQCASGFPNLCTQDGIWVYQDQGSMLIKYDEKGAAVYQQTVPQSTNGMYQEILVTDHYVCLRQDMYTFSEDNSLEPESPPVRFTMVDLNTQEAKVYAMKTEENTSLRSGDFFPYNGDLICMLGSHTDYNNLSTTTMFDIIDCRSGQIVKSIPAWYSPSTAAYDSGKQIFYMGTGKLRAFSEQTREIEYMAKLPDNRPYDLMLSGDTVYIWNIYDKILLALRKDTRGIEKASEPITE